MPAPILTPLVLGQRPPKCRPTGLADSLSPPIHIDHLLRESGSIGSVASSWRHRAQSFPAGPGPIRSEEGTADITVLGDAPNTAARLSTNAKQGEILVSEAACAAAGLQIDNLEQRELDLKGKTEPVSVCVLTDYSPLTTQAT